MDKETLTNHISKLGKHYFENACKIVLRDVFFLRAINVDGRGDGGTDFATLDRYGERIPVAYQITTQKTDIKNKAYRDAKKAIEKLKVDRYYFLMTYILEETEIRKLESKITNELNIQSICFDSSSIAALLLSENLLGKFLHETNYPLPNNQSTSDYDYREMAIHTYTLLSDESGKMRVSIYDDTILFILSNNKPLNEEELVNQVKSFLALNETKDDILIKRIGALFGKEKLKRTVTGEIELHENSKADIESRKIIYERELSNLIAAQTDLLRNEYQCDWSIEDSKKIAVWIADAFIAEQISNLKEMKASIVSHPIFENLDNDGIEKIKNYFIKIKKIPSEKINKLLEEMIKLASNHPLITKISRASMYLALKGSNPISSAKALGANRWSDFNIIVEPTVAIPFICSQLYQGKVNRFFDNAVYSIKRAKKLDTKLFIPYFYINECAGHLLRARKYNNLELNENELQYSSNAFVSNYFALKLNNVKVPENYLDYLSSYSSSIKIEKNDIKNWVREIMIDIQSILNKANIDFIHVPFYDHEKCKTFEEEYVYHLRELRIEKRSHLINHDVWALQFTNDKIINDNEKWFILAYDKSLISYSKSYNYKGLILNPIKFIDITESTKPLSETQFVSLLHSVASYSERTLSIGARIMDRIIMYASDKMQNWEFKKDIESFKNVFIQSMDDYSIFPKEVDEKTDQFLKEHGIILSVNEEEEVEVDEEIIDITKS